MGQLLKTLFLHIVINGAYPVQFLHKWWELDPAHLIVQFSNSKFLLIDSLTLIPSPCHPQSWLLTATLNPASYHLNGDTYFMSFLFVLRFTLWKLTIGEFIKRNVTNSITWAPPPTQLLIESHSCLAASS